MDGREIPGFYYDTEKKKYFRIQKTHQLAPDSKYSESNIKKEQRKQKVETKASIRTQKLQKETIVRRHVQSPLMHASLEREIGARNRLSHMRTIWTGACAAGISREPYQIIGWGDDNIRFFDRDPGTKNVYAVHSDNRIVRHRLNDERDEIARLTSTISSLVCLPASGALAATTRGSDRAPVIYISDPEMDGPYVGQQFTPRSTDSIWCAAARPTTFSAMSKALSGIIPATDTERLVVGTSNAMIMFARSPEGTWDSSTVFESDSDVLSVDWLSTQVVAIGCRNGKIHLHDTRSGGSSHILTHPSPIASLKRADDKTRIVCAGLRNSMALYDIRASRITQTSIHEQGSEVNSGGRKKRRKTQRTAFKQWSQPVLTFDYLNPDDLSLGMDVNPQLGLVAAIQEATTRTTPINVYNIWTGKVVKEMKQKREYEGVGFEWLKFMDTGDLDVDLWTSHSGFIQSYSW